MKIFKQSLLQKLILISVILFTALSIIIFLSIDSNQFSWWQKVKNYTDNGTLYPILTLIIGAIGTVISGTFMQYTTRNDLASPFTMGILPSVGLATVILRVLDFYSIWLTFFVAIIIAITILSFVVMSSNHAEKNNMIVIGLAVGMIIMGLEFLMSLNLPTTSLINKWFFREQNYFNQTRFAIFTPFIIVLSVTLIIFRKKTESYRRDPSKAISLGVDVKKLIIFNYSLSAIIAVASVFLIGQIAFVGMAIPNITRTFLKSDNLLINIVIGILISVPILLISYIIAAQLFVSYQMVSTAFCAPIFIMIIFLRRKYEK